MTEVAPLRAVLLADDVQPQQVVHIIARTEFAQHLRQPAHRIQQIGRGDAVHALAIAVAQPVVVVAVAEAAIVQPDQPVVVIVCRTYLF